MVNVDNDNIVLIYYYVALFSTIFYILKIFMFTFFGGDTEVHSDFNSSYESEDAFGFISIQSILAFLMGFGWLGLTSIKVWNTGIFLSVCLSFIFGLLLMFVSAYLMFCVKKLNKRVKKDYSQTVGKIGKAYTNFEPNGKGQIEININDQLSVVYATNRTQEKINAFDPIRVINCENNNLYIEKI